MKFFMTLQIMDSSKLAIAHGAYMRFQGRMDQLVRNHVVFSGKPLATNWAKVFFQHFLSIIVFRLVHLALRGISLRFTSRSCRSFGFIRRWTAWRPRLAAKQVYTGNLY